MGMCVRQVSQRSSINGRLAQADQDVSSMKGYCLRHPMKYGIVYRQRQFQRDNEALELVRAWHGPGVWNIIEADHKLTVAPHLRAHRRVHGRHSHAQELESSCQLFPMNLASAASTLDHTRMTSIKLDSVTVRNALEKYATINVQAHAFFVREMMQDLCLFQNHISWTPISTQ